MPIPNTLEFILGEITATAERKQELKLAFSKQVGWTEKITNEEGEEIDNPVTFQEVFNSGVWEYVRGTCAAGQQKLDKEAAEAPDDFTDLIE